MPRFPQLYDGDDACRVSPTCPPPHLPELAEGSWAALLLCHSGDLSEWPGGVEREACAQAQHPQGSKALQVSCMCPQQLALWPRRLVPGVFAVLRDHPPEKAGGPLGRWPRGESRWPRGGRGVQASPGHACLSPATPGTPPRRPSLHLACPAQWDCWAGPGHGSLLPGARRLPWPLPESPRPT